MEAEYTPEMGLIRQHRVLEEGHKFNVEVGQMLFCGSFESGRTLVTGFLE